LNRLTYYQFQLNVKAKQRSSPAGSKEKARWFGWPQEGLVQWASSRSSDTWAGFGKAPGGWKVCVCVFLIGDSPSVTVYLFQLKLHRAGERLVDRLDFEELALKSIDPSIGPSITSIMTGRLKEFEKENNEGQHRVS
jgi:hypothetical protein